MLAAPGATMSAMRPSPYLRLVLLCTGAMVAACEPTAPSLDGGQPTDAPTDAGIDAGEAADAAATPSDSGPPVDAAVQTDAATDVDGGSAPCGIHGGPCCPGDTCSHPALSCESGVCQGVCGIEDYPCCAGFHCSLTTECSPDTSTCVRRSVLDAYAVCDPAGSAICPFETTCLVSLLDARPTPVSTCTATCGGPPDEMPIPCPTDLSGRAGTCVETPAGPQCYLPCDGGACASGFVCMRAAGEFGDVYVCVPGDADEAG